MDRTQRPVSHTKRNSEFELRARPDWAEMNRVYKETNDFLTGQGLSSEAINKYTMVVCELVENGLKYGSFGDGFGEVNVNVKIDDQTIMVQVTNPISQDSESHLVELDKTIQKVRGYQDPFEAYIERMRAISMEPLENARSCLGIVRVTYEGQSVLDFFVDEDNTLSVSAVARIE